LIGIEAHGRLPLLLVAQRMFTGIDSFPLMAIPLFILAGNLMSAGGISHRLVELAKSIVGGIQGGLAASCVLTCMMFASVSGSSVATTFAIGAILIPAMVRHGYPKPLGAGQLRRTGRAHPALDPAHPLWRIDRHVDRSAFHRRDRAGAIRGLAGRRAAVLLAHHGPLVASRDLEAAVFAMEELEETAKLALLLRGTGAQPLDSAQIGQVVRKFEVDWD
jgi:hypothetical protein